MLLAEIKKNIPLIYAAIGLLFLLLTNTAYLMPYLNTPPGHHYTGAGLEAVGDKFIYYSNVLQGKQGMLFQNNMQTGEPQEPRIFSPVWYVVGMTARIFNISHITAYHVWRVILTLLYLCMLVFIVRKLFPRERDRLIALLVILFGSGLSWAYAEVHPEIFAAGVHWLRDFQASPAELYVTEMYPFLAFVQSPLFMVSHIALLACFAFGIATVERTTLIRGVLLTLSCCMLALIHPYDALIMGFVFTSWCVWKAIQQNSWRPFIIGAAAGVGLLVGTAVTLALFWSQPALSGWLSQNVTFSPRIAMYLWSFGLLTPLWLLGLFVLLRRKNLNDWQALMGIWSIAGWILIYLPIATNRRLTNAWFIPVAVVASFGIQYLMQRVRTFTLRTALVWLLVIFIGGGTLWRTVVYAVYAPTLDQKYEAYLDDEIYSALQYTAHNVPSNSLVISNEPFIAMLTSAYAPVRIFLGHQHQTVNYFMKKQQSEWFFSDTTNETEAARKQNFLIENGISYIMFYKPSLKTDSWIPKASYLEKIYSSEPLDVYRVMSSLAL